MNLFNKINFNKKLLYIFIIRIQTKMFKEKKERKNLMKNMLLIKMKILIKN